MMTKRGDHIMVVRNLYTHHGIDMGDGTVIHYTGEPMSKSSAIVKKTSKAEFLKGGEEKVEFSCEKEGIDPDLVISRALSRLGEQKYSLLFNNCEHFANWCFWGEAVSRQSVFNSRFAHEKEAYQDFLREHDDDPFHGVDSPLWNLI